MSGKAQKLGFSIFFLNLFSMDSFQFWLYVIIAVIYLISRARKKKADESPGPVDAGRDRPMSSPPGKLGFALMLRSAISEPPRTPASDMTRCFQGDVAARGTAAASTGTEETSVMGCFLDQADLRSTSYWQGYFLDGPRGPGEHATPASGAGSLP